MLEITELVKRYGDVQALDGCSLRVPPGHLVGLLGPNGAGKTTAVRILATLLRPDGGQARVGGYDVVRQADRVRELIGLTGQYAAVDEELTGYENLMLIGRLMELPRRDARARATELLERFALADAGRRSLKTYSGGMRRRLDLAASLVVPPSVLFLDEPTTGLDPRSRGDVWQMVRELVADGVTVLLTTQYLDEADRLAGEIAVIDHGRLIASGTPAELKARTGALSLVVRPAHEVDLPTVTGVVAALASGTPDVRGGVVSAAVADPAVLPAVVRRLDDAGVLVAELTLRGSTLDEVFLSLTGHRAEPTDKELARSAA